MTPTALILTAVAVVFIIGLVAVIVERTEQRDEANALASEAHQTAAKAVNEAEWFRKTAEALADEQKATHAANEILCAELAASDEKNRRLSNDLREAKTRISDLVHDAEHAPAPVIPLPVVRDGSHDDLAALDAEATAYTWPSIARDAFPVREWGEEAEK